MGEHTVLAEVSLPVAGPPEPRTSESEVSQLCLTLRPYGL